MNILCVVAMFGTHFVLADDNLEVLKMGCFKYFEKGGACVEDPVSLLSGYASRFGT